MRASTKFAFVPRAPGLLGPVPVLVKQAQSLSVGDTQSRAGGVALEEVPEQ